MTRMSLYRAGRRTVSRPRGGVAPCGPDNSAPDAHASVGPCAAHLPRHEITPSERASVPNNAVTANAKRAIGWG